MFRRLLLDDWMSVFVIIAFATALTVYLLIFYRALRMRRAQVEHFANLPLQDSNSIDLTDRSDSSRHE
jgi:heme/copper-type cytochrome/quinol oxidase subunit 2